MVLLLVPSVSFGAKDDALLGYLSKLGVSDETLNAKLGGSVLAITPFTGFKFFDTLNSMLAALGSKRIAAVEIDEYTAGYLLSRTKNYTALKPSGFPVYHVKYSMLLREEDSALCGQISSVIAGMKADGTLEALKNMNAEFISVDTGARSTALATLSSSPLLQK